MTEPAFPPVAALVGSSTALGAPLREAFSRSVARGARPAQLAVSIGGESIVDLVSGGLAADTPVQVFSVSKLLVAAAAVHAHDRGFIDLDAPLAEYWPAFDRASTRGITAMHVLDHSSGISAVSVPLSTDDLVADKLDELVEREEPLWAPGTAHGYGAFTFGALMAGVFRHGVGTSVQEYVAEHLVRPTGARFTFGADEATRGRLAPITFRSPVVTEASANEFMTGTALQDGSMLPIMTDSAGFFTDPRVQAATWPSMSGVTTAHDLVAIFSGAMGYGGAPPALSPAAIARLTTERHHGPDRGLPYLSRYGAGAELPHELLQLLGPNSFGHQGAAGSVVAIDPDTETVFAYTSTLMDATVGISDQALVLLGVARSVVAPALAQSELQLSSKGVSR